MPYSVEGLKKYQALFLAGQRSPYIDWPVQVQIETQAICNAGCIFCPYPNLDRKGYRMEDEVINKIIEDLKHIPRSLPFRIALFKMNEPFLDERLFSILKTINKHLPNAYIRLASNGSPLTKDKMVQLGNIKNISRLSISVNDHRAKEYERIMSLPFSAILKKLDMIHAFKAQAHFPLEIVLTRVGDNSDVDKDFICWADKRYPLFKSLVISKGNWLGKIPSETSNIPNVGCLQWFGLSIAATGIVTFCCMDSEGVYPRGDVRKSHVLDIYNDPSYKKLRRKVDSRLEVLFCRQCYFLQPVSGFFQTKHSVPG